MSAERRRAHRPKPPKPPVMIRADLYFSYVWYEFKHHWKMRLIGLAFLVAVIGMCFWALQVRMPTLESYTISPPTLADIEGKNKSLKQELQQLSTKASNEVLAQTNSKLVDGYTGLSLLLEDCGSHAEKLGLLMQYELAEPTQQSGAISDVFLVGIAFTFIPRPEVPISLIWERMMRQVKWMAEHRDVYQLQNSHVSGDGKRMLSMQLDMQVRMSQDHALLMKGKL